MHDFKNLLSVLDSEPLLSHDIVEFCYELFLEQILRQSWPAIVIDDETLNGAQISVAVFLLHSLEHCLTHKFALLFVFFVGSTYPSTIAIEYPRSYVLKIWIPLVTQTIH